jgi:murein DD-endopeptidase MepM/ murein hydrolase activator NlpD
MKKSGVFMNKLTEHEESFKTNNSLETLNNGNLSKDNCSESGKRVGAGKGTKVIIAIIVSLCAVVGVLGLPKALDVYASAYYITADGNKLVALANQKQAYQAIDNYLSDKSQEIGVDVEIKESVDLAKVDRDGCSLCTVTEAAEILDQKLTPIAQMAAIKIDDQEELYLANEEDAKKAIQAVKDYYIDEGDTVIDVKFAQKVSVESPQKPVKEMVTPEVAANMLLFGSPQQMIHIVESNDETLWTIAKQYDIPIKTLKKANDGLTSDDLELGSSVKLAENKSLINVEVTKEVVKKAALPFNVESQNDSSLMRGKTEILSEGKIGEEEVTWQVTEENGVMISQERISSVVMIEPVNKVVARGTKMTVAARDGSGGAIGWPLVGKINSYFGPRSLGYHTGIDIDGETGDPYVAADDGKVIFVGWEGAYGYMVKVDHGGGLETWYAHSSKTCVSKGESVAKGQKLGEVGSTGRSTGPHLHFEVRINGDYYDPLKYLP